MKKFTRKDFILIVAILVIAAVGALANFIIRQRPAARVEVSVDGSVVATYRLDDEVDTILETWSGGSNHLVIHEGSARITEASCPDHICVNEGRISQNGEMIVCLPNRLIVRVVEPER
ncbi:MAG: NusG domain II-containing protein [Clostridiales bacterium]|nr:NusG domain II-containing protein [Clostridiales bacterium]